MSKVLIIEDASLKIKKIIVINFILGRIFFKYE